ncbi:hypothetical protein H2204_004277 [Knufia peltigerae]|uniref:AB hydrolase-1 domain-containing protein n=1 Tax=Knufia peltigerae TaxID=1002370 RepID=A0AA39CYQ0_9EURO|nr:hypothetical protein H2204_004277 [Knufia peltigerae]
MSKPAIVLVPGAWHKPQHYKKVINGLLKLSYDAVGVSLPSVDAKPATPSWEKDAAAVREAVLQKLDAGKDVITIGHSYGGLPMGEGVKGLGKKAREAQGFKTSVTRLIYMCSVPVKEGQIFQEACKPVTEEEIKAAEMQMKTMKADEDGNLVPTDKELGKERLYNRCDPKDVKEALELIGSHSLGTLITPATWTPYKEIPSTYIVTENDLALLPSIQERIIAEAEGAFQVERCQEGHSPFLSNPDFIISCIRRAAGENV